MNVRRVLSVVRRVRLAREFRDTGSGRGRVVLAVAFRPDPDCPACAGRGEVERWSNDPPDLWGERCGCTGPTRDLSIPLRRVPTLDAPPF